MKVEFAAFDVENNNNNTKKGFIGFCSNRCAINNYSIDLCYFALKTTTSST